MSIDLINKKLTKQAITKQPESPKKILFGLILKTENPKTDKSQKQSCDPGNLNPLSPRSLAVPPGLLKSYIDKLWGNGPAKVWSLGALCCMVLISFY